MDASRQMGPDRLHFAIPLTVASDKEKVKRLSMRYNCLTVSLKELGLSLPSMPPGTGIRWSIHGIDLLIWSLGSETKTS